MRRLKSEQGLGLRASALAVAIILAGCSSGADPVEAVDQAESAVASVSTTAPITATAVPQEEVEEVLAEETAAEEAMPATPEPTEEAAPATPESPEPESPEPESPEPESPEPIADTLEFGRYTDRFFCVTGIVAPDTLNLRAGPSLDEPILTELQPDECGLELISDRGDWLELKDSAVGGPTGFASARFLTEPESSPRSRWPSDALWGPDPMIHLNLWHIAGSLCVTGIDDSQALAVYANDLPDALVLRELRRGECGVRAVQFAPSGNLQIAVEIDGQMTAGVVAPGFLQLDPARVDERITVRFEPSDRDANPSFDVFDLSGSRLGDLRDVYEFRLGDLPEINLVPIGDVDPYCRPIFLLANDPTETTELMFQRGPGLCV